MAYPTIRSAGATVVAALLAGSGLSSAAAEETFETQLHDVQVETVAEGLVHPWGLALMPDGRYLVTERDDRHLRIGTADGALSDPLEGIPEVYSFVGETPRTQGGLFDVKLHPDFAENGIIYVSLAKHTERGAAVAVLRARLEGEGIEARLEEVEEIWVMQEDDQDPSGLHFGGRMAVHPDDGSILLSIGDRRNISRSQDPEDQAGAILRIAEDGEPHPDRPAFAAGEANEYLLSMGHRNVQALGFDAQGQLWVADHGPRGGDEINRVEAGQNYGWPFITGGIDYSGAPIGMGLEHEDMVSPVHVFEDTLAPSGLAFYGSDMFPEWRGDMLIGGLAGQTLARMRIEGDQGVEEEWMLEGLERRIRDVEVADDGSIWLITEHEDGEVLRLTAVAPGL